MKTVAKGSGEGFEVNSPHSPFAFFHPSLLSPTTQKKQASKPALIERWQYQWKSFHPLLTPHPCMHAYMHALTSMRTSWEAWDRDHLEVLCMRRPGWVLSGSWQITSFEILRCDVHVRPSRWFCFLCCLRNINLNGLILHKMISFKLHVGSKYLMLAVR